MKNLPVNEIVCGEAEEVLKTLPGDSINCCISSPPYWALRDYGIDGQLGLEPTFEEYIDKLCGIYDEVKRVLRPDGCVFVNLGDTYGTHAGTKNSKHAHNFKPAELAISEGIYQPRKRQSVPEKCLCLIPQRFAIEMVSRGWILRNVLIWHKPNPMPSSAKDRFTVDFEYVYFFVKNKKYWFEQQFEPYLTESNAERPRMGQGQNTQYEQKRGEVKSIGIIGEHDNRGQTPGPLPSNPLGRNKRCVWTIPTEPRSDFGETYRLCRAAEDGQDNGIAHIVSPSCRLHGGLFDLLAKHDGGGHRDNNLLPRILYTYDYLSEVQPSDFVPTVPPHAYHLGRHNWDYLLRKCYPSATDRNSENHKKALALLTNPSCKPSVQRLSRILRILVSRGLSEQGANIYENNTWQDELDARLLGQMTFRIIDKPSYQKLLKEPDCQCGLYHISIQRTSHFATFPQKLVEPMILSGCPRYICTKCDKAREKILDRPKLPEQLRNRSDDTKMSYHTQQVGGGQKLQDWYNENPKKVIGYADCGCGAEWRSGICLDMFCGSGTVCRGAAQKQRDYIGIDLNPEYIEKIAIPFVNEVETGVGRKETGQQALFS